MIHLKVSHVLVPADFSETSENAIDYALTIARKFNAKITLMHVHEMHSHEMITPEGIAGDLVIDTPYDQMAIERLDAYRNRILETYQGTVDIVISSGRVPQEIADFSKAEGVDLIVMGTHGTKGIEEFFLGSNAYRVICLARCPVITVRPGAQANFNNVVVPMDETRFSRQKLPYCAEFAKAFDASLKILCLCEMADKEEIQRIETICRQVEHFLGEQHQVKFTFNHVEAGNTAEEVVRFAEYTEADLVVIMSETETNMTELMLGHYAREVVNHSKVPVLTLHPESAAAHLDIFG